MVLSRHNIEGKTMPVPYLAPGAVAWLAAGGEDKVLLP